MGIHDREYYRGDEHPGRSGAHGPAWSIVAKLIVVSAGLYLLDAFAGRSHWLMSNLAATTESLTKPQLWWQLVSYGFAHSTRDVFHLFWNMFALWVFGRQVEDIYGPKEFLRIYLVSIFLGGLVWAARTYLSGGGTATLVGASGAVTAITLLFCIHYPKQTILLMMVIPVPAWLVGVMIIVGNLVGMRYSGENVAFDVHLVGAAFAIAYYGLGWNLGRWLPAFAWPPFGKKRFFSSRPRLRVHVEQDDDSGPSDQLEAQADVLLEKVNRDGVDSLTVRERKILEDYSRQMRDKRR